VTGRGEAEGDARLRVGAAVDLRGLGPLFDGRYTVTETRHTIDGLGFKTQFAVERPGIHA
jgi:phage protein D